MGRAVLGLVVAARGEAVAAAVERIRAKAAEHRRHAREATDPHVRLIHRRRADDYDHAAELAAMSLE